MTTKTVYIVGPRTNVLATAEVCQRGDVFSGTIDLSSLPLTIQQTFEEFEEIVNGQMFSLLDEIQERIDGLSLRVLFEQNVDRALCDLQVYPSTRRVSFKLATSGCDRTTHA